MKLASSKKDKDEVFLLFDPKDRKEYNEMLKNMDKMLEHSNFWESISSSMQDLLHMML